MGRTVCCALASWSRSILLEAFFFRGAARRRDEEGDERTERTQTDGLKWPIGGSPVFQSASALRAAGRGNQCRGPRYLERRQGWQCAGHRSVRSRYSSKVGAVQCR
ncbi:hypothetical protein J3F83DRAFT_753602 [Trichoderma novae-zelandiae]